MVLGRNQRRYQQKSLIDASQLQPRGGARDGSSVIPLGQRENYVKLFKLVVEHHLLVCSGDCVCQLSDRQHGVEAVRNTSMFARMRA